MVLYDCPDTMHSYLHRVGRTARAGRGGKATSFVLAKDMPLIHKLQVRVTSVSATHTYPLCACGVLFIRAMCVLIMPV